MKSQVEKAKEVVEKITMGNIESPNRLRNNVESRMIYSKLLRESGLTFKYIGSTMKKDHTTVIHYVNLLKSLIETEPSVNHKYAKCRDLFFAGRENHKIEYDSVKMSQKLEEYMSAYRKVLGERDRAVDFNRRVSRLRDIVELVNERTPKGQERRVWMMINRMFNGGMDTTDE